MSSIFALRVAALALFGIHAASAAVITETHTLYYVPRPTDSASPVSWEIQETAEVVPLATLDGGSVTRYQQVVVQSLAVVHNLSPTDSSEPTAVTVLSQPTTRTHTYEEGAATYRQSIAQATTTRANGRPRLVYGYAESCAHNIKDKTGACVVVEEGLDSAGPATGIKTSTLTYSGSLVPYATITTTAEATTNAAPSSMAFSRAAALGVAGSVLTVFLGALLV